MRWKKTFGKAVSAIAMAIGIGLSGCDNMNMNINGSDMDGVPLSEIDMSGDAPTGVTLAGPDTVRIVEGSEFGVTVDGSEAAKQRMRFSLDGDSFAVMRDNGDWSDSDRATVNITMPAPSDLTIAGSGTLESAAISDTADLTIAGSGSLKVTKVAASSLDVTIAGSGSITAAGTAEQLDLSVLGSGQGDLAGLKAGNADVNIAGSGQVVFASDGKVEANIMGSGEVTVRGSATCEVNSMGSGVLRCEPAGAPQASPETRDEAGE